MSQAISFVIGLTVVVLLFLFTPLFPPIVAEDVVQPRVNQALPILRDGVTIEQTFTPRHNGLTSIDVHLARHDPDPSTGALTLELTDRRGRTVATRTFDSQNLTHNQLLRLDFSPQPASAGAAYALRATGTGDNPFSLWGYTLNPLGGDSRLTVRGAENPAGSLSLTTQYRLLGGDAVTYLLSRAVQEGSLWLLALAFIAMPGALLFTLWHLWNERRFVPRMPLSDTGAWCGLAIALGMALWALLWMWLSLAGLHLNGALLWILFVVGWLTVAFASIRQWRAHPRSSRNTQYAIRTNPLPLTPYLLLLILLTGFAARLIAIRDLAIPPWVDSIRHALITTLMVDQGQVLTDYAPLLPVERFPYHFGFHTIPASLALMTGWDLASLLLSLGQLLNALTPLAVYTGAWLFTRRRDISLGAAFLVALPFLFPGYYATWGRYTQLTGMLILPPLAGLFVRLIAGARAWRRTWWLVALLAAGLFLAHIRVFIYLLPLPFVIWLWHKGRSGRRLFLAAALGGLLVLPRVFYLLPRQASPAVFLNNIENYNTFPTGYYLAGWEQGFAVAAIVAALLVILANGRQRPWTTPLLYLVLWVGLLFSTLAGRRVGLPESWLVNLNSMVITLFFPQSLLLAALFVRLWRWFHAKGSSRPPLSLVLNSALVAGIGVLVLFGLRFQSTILNPDTVLAYPDDKPALEWVARNTPEDAVFAVSSFRWLGNTWSGADGGAWIVPLTHRASRTPPADYEYDVDLTREVVAFNEQLNTITEWRDPANIDWLRSQGVTHIFVGARGGTFDPAALVENPAVELLHQNGNAFVFRLR